MRLFSAAIATSCGTMLHISLAQMRLDTSDGDLLFKPLAAVAADKGGYSGHAVDSRQLRGGTALQHAVT
jgi:hypothetical protein